MSETETMTREQQLAEEFKAGLSHDDAPQLAKRVADLEAERDAAIERAEKAERARDRAKAKVNAGEAPAKLRKIAAGDDTVTDIAAAIAAADKVEIVLSDGTREIDGVDPFVVEGEAWKPTPNGLMLSVPLDLYGPGSGKPAYRIEGYALMLDGKQVAYRQRPDPITVVPGHTYKIEDDIIF